MKIKMFIIKVEVKKHIPYAKLQATHKNKKAYNRQAFKRGEI